MKIGIRPDLFTPQQQRAINVAVDTADRLGMSLFMVGGSVRDLLLGQPTLDIDLVVEGDAISVARHAANDLATGCTVHSGFGTATIRGEGYTIDLAMSRSESYSRPGALPKVSPSSIEIDLLRRDFTVNAIGLAVSGPDEGTIIDPSKGLQDLRRRQLRVIQERSFIDDASRILRAVRYRVRLKFAIEPHTLSLLQRDLSYLDTVSGSRIRRELTRLLRENKSETALELAQDLGVLEAIHPAFRLSSHLSAALADSQRGLMDKTPITVYMGLLAHAWSAADAVAIADRLSLPKKERSIVEAMPEIQALAPLLTSSRTRPSQITSRLSPFPPAALRALVSLTKDTTIKERVRRYLSEWRHVQAELNGAALLELGVAKGPQLGHLISQLRSARLDGMVSSREEEIRLARTIAGKSSPTASRSDQ